MRYFYEKELATSIGPGKYFSPSIYEEPINLGKKLSISLLDQGQIINDFMTRVSALVRDALIRNDIDVLRIVFSETFCGLDIPYHESLPTVCWKPPLFYRTDQSVSGKIYEIQAPGSGWGDLYLLGKCYQNKGFSVSPIYSAFPSSYAKIINDATGKEKSAVFHMIDAASVPHSMRYLFSITRNNLRYWGLDNDVNMHTVDFVTSHSVYSLSASNYFSTYLQKASSGELVFGTPPNIIFDEKATYLLPFHRKTRKYFSDEIRSLFPYTTLLEDEGYYDENDVFHKLEDLIASDRPYYLKYGGPNTAKNWGSRSVFRINKNSDKKYLEMAKNLSKKGELWLIQDDDSKSGDVQNDSEDVVAIRQNGNHIKLSGFYGSNTLLGVKTMMRRHFKVHGQPDALIGIGQM